MSEEISGRMGASLRRLYLKSENKEFFTWAAARQNDSAETSVDTVMRRGRMGREVAVGLLQDLAKAGLGDFYVGRRGSKTRIEWKYSLRDVGSAASGRIDVVGEIDEDTLGDKEDEEGDVSDAVEHLFNLRSGVRVSISLPGDLTRREADRLAAFIKTLPLESD